MANFIRGPWFMAIIIALVSAVVIALVIFGVVTHHEPGVMANWPLWQPSSMPLNVCTTAYGDDCVSYDCLSPESRTAEGHVAESYAVINQRLGFTAFETRQGPCDVPVVVGVPAEADFMDPGGDARMSTHPTDSGRMLCHVQTANTGTDEMLDLVLQHELGHCLGLAHDPEQTSIMRPVQSPTPSGTFPPRISDSDRELLRGLYVR